MVVDALRRMTEGSVSHLEEAKKNLVKDIHRLSRLVVRSKDSLNCGFMVHHNSKSPLVVEVKSKQHIDQPLKGLNRSIVIKLNESFSFRGMVS